MTLEEFKTWLIEDVTMSGLIQVNITPQETERLIKKEINNIYQLDPRSLEKKYTILPRDLFYTPEFRATRTINFPDCVFTIGKFVEMGRRQNILGTYDPAFSLEKMFMSNIFSGGYTGITMEATALWTINWSVYDQMKNFVLVDIQHKWNEMTHQLLVTGHDPRYHVWCELYAKVPPSDLYDDIYCQRWISAKCKMNVARMIGTFTTQLIGGVTVNSNMYTDEAKEDINECKEYWKSLREADMFFVTTP